MPLTSPKKMQQNQQSRNAKRVDQLLRVQAGKFNTRQQNVLYELRSAGLVEYNYNKITGEITGPVTLTGFGIAFLKHHEKPPAFTGGCDRNGEGRQGCGRPDCQKCYPK